MKITFLFDGIHDIDRQPQAFKKGETVEVNEADAKRLIDGLCAEEYKEPKAKVKYGKNSK